jgi:hypothetical protein
MMKNDGVKASSEEIVAEFVAIDKNNEQMPEELIYMKRVEVDNTEFINLHLRILFFYLGILNLMDGFWRR